jgi:hypothetical protein
MDERTFRGRRDDTLWFTRFGPNKCKQLIINEFVQIWTGLAGAEKRVIGDLMGQAFVTSTDTSVGLFWRVFSSFSFSFSFSFCGRFKCIGKYKMAFGEWLWKALDEDTGSGNNINEQGQSINH